MELVQAEENSSALKMVWHKVSQVMRGKEVIHPTVTQSRMSGPEQDEESVAAEGPLWLGWIPGEMRGHPRRRQPIAEWEALYSQYLEHSRRYGMDVVCPPRFLCCAFGPQGNDVGK